MRWRSAAVDRRTLLIGGGAGVGLIVALAAWPRRDTSPLRGGDGETLFGPFIRIARDGRVTVAVPQVETGQGIWTGLAQVVADELGAAWTMVAVEPAPLSPEYRNPLAGDTRLTARSTSIRAFEPPMRSAAALARAMLCDAAATRWGVDIGACETSEGFVHAGAQRAAFGDLAEEASRGRIPSVAPVRIAASSGRALPRLDLPAKSNGSLRFAGDVRLPAMRFASVRMAPPGGRIASFDRASGEAAGARLVVGERWVAAIAETGWAADRALSTARLRFTGLAGADTPTIEQRLTAALEAPMERVISAGDYDEAVAGKRPLAATYRIAPTPQLALEPPAVALRFSGDRLEVWAATIAPDLARAAAARAAGIGEAAVTLYPMPVGGGAPMDHELIEVGVAVARAVKAPICLSMNAASGQNQGLLRPPLAARISALADGDGGLASWRGRFAGAAGLEAALARARGEPTPAFVARGAAPPYAAGATLIEAGTVSLPIACGTMRGDVEALTAFANESFVDELARARGIEPLAFRIGLLGGQPRLARVLSSAARVGGWDGGARGSSLGIACATAFGSHIALLAEASIGPDQRIAVTRLVAAVDAGRLVNPGLVRQQVEGGLLHALVAATGAAPEIVAGMPRARPLGALGVPTLKAQPRVEVVLVPGTAAPGGVSGLGALVLAAAVGNAIYAATGLRLRRLPFDPMSPS